MPTWTYTPYPHYKTIYEHTNHIRKYFLLVSCTPACGLLSRYSPTMLSRSAECRYPTLLLPAQREGFSAPVLEIIGSSIGPRLWKRDPACDIVNLTTRRRPGLAWGHRARARCHQLLPHLADLAHLPQRHVQRAFAQHRAATQLGHCFWGLSTAAIAASPSQGACRAFPLRWRAREPKVR